MEGNTNIHFPRYIHFYMNWRSKKKSGMHDFLLVQSEIVLVVNWNEILIVRGLKPPSFNMMDT